MGAREGGKIGMMGEEGVVCKGEGVRLSLGEGEAEWGLEGLKLA